MADKCERCDGVDNEPPDGWKTGIPPDTWRFWKPIVYALLLLIFLTAVAVAFVAFVASFFQLSHPDATRAASWAQVFITALAGMAAGVAGVMAIRHVDQVRSTNQLNALAQAWASVNNKWITKRRKELYKELVTSQKYRCPENWTEDLEGRAERVANPLDFAGWMVIKGLLSPAVVASAYGEVFIRTYAVLQHWIEKERHDYRPKEFKKGLEQIALWAAVNDQNCRESFNHGHHIEFAFWDDGKRKAEQPICIWEATAAKSSASG
jgi:hypothetical protein